MRERVLHYELLDRLGEGGMGVVYRARDTDLEREVALKFLSADLQASGEEVDRFLHEARAISRLNHPNIATIYAVEENRGERFLAFEFLPGGTLREQVKRLRDSGEQLPFDKVLAWGVRIARALAHAHRHGIVHRDVKGDNVLLTADGEVKLTDFGVAQVADRRSAKSETVGTAAYMSPEQAQGLAVDHRSDIFSFGVLLYELAAGRPPFHDEQEAVVLYDIVNSPHPPISELREDVPGAFEKLLDKLLAKRLEERCQSMEDVVAELEALSSELHLARTRKHAATPAEPTIAVLPFVDMSPEGDQEYFCDGITEEIILALSEVKGLKVVSRTSSFQFKGQAYDIRQIGHKLKVETVLEGSVRKAGDKLRISVQHINVADGYHLWSERYDRRLEDVFAIQDEIAQAIVSILQGRLAARREGRRPTTNIEAYNLYLEGRYFHNQRTRASLGQALERFHSAIELDPEFAAAYAGLAEVHVLMASGAYGNDGPHASLQRAREAADEAIALDDSRAEAHVAKALVFYRADWDWESAEQEFRRAIELNSGYATAHHQYALFLAALLRLDEARAEISRAHELDPLSLIISTAVGRIWHFSRDYDKAIEQCRRTMRMNPEFAPAYFDLAIAYCMKEEFDEAVEIIEALEKLSPDPLRYYMLISRIQAEKGNREEALRLREKVIELSGERYVAPMVMSILEIGLGNVEEAMQLLEESYERHDNIVVYLLCEPTWDAVRAHPRYPELVKNIFPNQA